MSEAGNGPQTRARVGVAVPAAGSGQRMGGVRKAFLELAGEATLLHALRPFLADERVVAVAVALAPDDATSAPPWLTALDERITVVQGGATRSASVRAAVGALPGALDVIAVHDAARPLVTEAIVSACIDLAAIGVGAVAGTRAVDTMKLVDPDGSIVDTPDRSRLWHAQTPQVFPAAVLRAAYRNPDADGTDDAALVERLGDGIEVKMVDAGAWNLKVTRPDDVSIAEAVLERRRRSSSADEGAS